MTQSQRTPRKTLNVLYVVALKAPVHVLAATRGASSLSRYESSLVCKRAIGVGRAGWRQCPTRRWSVWAYCAWSETASQESPHQMRLYCHWRTVANLKNGEGWVMEMGFGGGTCPGGRYDREVWVSCCEMIFIDSTGTKLSVNTSCDICGSSCGYVLQRTDENYWNVLKSVWASPVADEHIITCSDP